uniref:Uncharacterized protein n=1 Tax=Noctiluca scintillans TaxID=2966 RepID=A0A7S1A9K6_NOCSC|eukprot:CAMPEP_0194490096 /NCGR_PEP_ID=MMETSP0253-20130528/9429_1 /TAXON_ID=2966 /ORGANISM="Noctiluca scintillans" /LENGTH=145 /DNA_ID=CAMNT_0039330679 /DNA_START=25 /DNA_END=462 /DNA_ORIENTATION=-
MLGDITNVVALRDITNAGGSAAKLGVSTKACRGFDSVPTISYRHAGHDLPLFSDVQAKRARRCALEEAIATVQDSLLSTGLDSEWTSVLAERLVFLDSNSELNVILRVHGWNGTQFCGPPDREQLLLDLRKPVAHWRARPRRGGA